MQNFGFLPWAGVTPAHGLSPKGSRRLADIRAGYAGMAEELEVCQKRRHARRF